MDSDQQAKAWLLNVQRKLYQWSKANPKGPYRNLWNWVIDHAICDAPGAESPPIEAVVARE